MILSFFSFLILFLNFGISIGQSKIYNFDVLVCIKQHVLWFKVSMDNFKLVEVIYAIDNLMEEPA